MVWLKQGIGSVEGILIDGYIPKFESFQECDSKQLKAYLELVPCNPRYVYRKYLRPDREAPSKDLQHRVYEYLAEGVRAIFCPVKGDGRVPSSYGFYPAKGYHRIERIISANKREAREYLSAFLEEIDHDVQKEDYGLNVIIYDRFSNNYCGLQDECCGNGINKLGFKVKPKQNYGNYHRFEKAAKEFLKSQIREAIKYEWCL
jgi:hypothetical protein